MNEDIITIDFKAFFRILWKEKLWMFLITAIFGAIGIFYALSLKDEFQAKGKILPEVQGKGGGLGQFSGLASLAGIDLGSVGGAGGDAIRPDLYPDVINSTPFYLELLKIKVRTKDNSEMTFEEYYHKSIEKGETAKEEDLKKYPVKENGIIVINKLNEERLKDLRSRINASIDKKSGVISIQAKMQDPIVAAEVTRFAMEYLMDYVMSYRTEKLRKDVDYLGSQVAASKGKFYASQEQKARYSDQFQSNTIRLQSADVQRERIESEYRVSSSFYNELLKKYEEAKLRLQQETPVFQILEAPVAPVNKSEPKRSLILVGFVFLGSFLATIFSLVKKKNYKSIIQSA